MSSAVIRFGLIGTGRIGQVHAANIAAHPDAVLSWVADPFLDGANQIAAQFGGHPTDSTDEVIDSGGIDAVLIASPTSTHVDLIRRALTAGIPVLCEKPIDLDISRVDALRPLVASSGVPVALGFNRRFDPAFAEVRQRVHEGEIGALQQLTIISRDPTPPPAAYLKVSGGIFRDMTIHDFDMARFFVPDIVEVTAIGTTFFDDTARELGDYDTAISVLRSSSGVTVSITNSRRSAYGYDQRLEAFGENGALNVSNARTSLVSISNASSVESTPPYQTFFLERYAQAYAEELNEFIRLIRGQPSTAATYEDGRAALVLADAAEKSALEQRSMPVDVAEPIAVSGHLSQGVSTLAAR